MSRSNELEQLVVVAARAQGIPIEDQWVSEIAVHLQRLFDAAKIVDQSDMKSQELAQRFFP
jgi:hypothetical protein